MVVGYGVLSSRPLEGLIPSRSRPASRSRYGYQAPPGGASRHAWRTHKKREKQRFSLTISRWQWRLFVDQVAGESCLEANAVAGGYFAVNLKYDLAFKVHEGRTGHGQATIDCP